jgi:ABC-type bacteriocin/lantibiotic exporter with double-glycine peptidase domain
MPAAVINKFPIIRPEEGADCALICLAFYLGEPYDDVLRAVSHVDKKFMGKDGLSTRQIKQVAKVMGHPLKTKRKIDFDEDYGIVMFTEHVVVLRNGLIFETNGTVMEYQDYATANPGLRVVGGILIEQ